MICLGLSYLSGNILLRGCCTGKEMKVKRQRNVAIIKEKNYNSFNGSFKKEALGI